MTDPSINRRLRLTDEAAFSHHLRSTRHVSRYAEGLSACGPIVIRPAGSRLLDPVAGATWLAVGDSTRSSIRCHPRGL